MTPLLLILAAFGLWKLWELARQAVERPRGRVLWTVGPVTPKDNPQDAGAEPRAEKGT